MLRDDRQRIDLAQIPLTASQLAVLRVRKWRALNPERARESDRQRYQQNREVVRKRSKARAKTNAAKDTVRRWQTLNIEKKRAYTRNYQARHRDRHAETTREWRKRNRERTLASRRADQNRRRTRLQGVEIHHSNDEWTFVCALFRFQCLACGRGDKLLSRDHIVPLSHGGGDEIENIQPLCRSCNGKKGARTIDYR